MYMAYALLRMFTQSRALLTMIPVAVGVPVYAMLLIGTRTISKNEILQMPKGKKLVSILQKVRLLK